MPEELLDLLPEYSPWPARLLGLVDWSPRKKAPSELIREFETEKWGPLWKQVSSSPVPLRLQNVEQILFDDEKNLMCWTGERLAVMRTGEARRRQFELIAQALEEFHHGETILELGAGYGQMILNLAGKETFRQSQFFAGEYTQSGIHLIETLSKAHNLSLQVCHCDFAVHPWMPAAVPAHATIFTSYSAHYVPEYDESFLDSATALDADIILHFEPMYEHCDPSRLLGLLQKRYIEANDYNRNLLSLLKRGEKHGRLNILQEKRQVFGINPLLPMSLVAWRPLK